MSLHDELETFDLVNWHIYTIIHAMIDAGRVERLECQHPHCLLPTREFSKEMGKHNRAAIALDHIVPQREHGSHQMSNLRIVHRVCNWAWRRGVIGTFQTEESKKVLSEKALAQHAAGRGPNYSDPVRNARISAALTGRGSEIAKRGWITRRQRQES